MKKLIILFLTIIPIISNAQKLEIYTDEHGYKYLALYAYGLSREVVKTNAEIKASKFGDTGILRRHHTTKPDAVDPPGADVDKPIGTEGYDNNQKISFGFLIAPYNVDEDGNELTDENAQKMISWYDASGWDQSIDFANSVRNLGEGSKANPTPRGCAAYTGPTKKDPVGSWRLPTQREMMSIFTIMEHALTMQGANQVTNLITHGTYWTSTEHKTSFNWKVWTVDSRFGSVVHINKIDDWGDPVLGHARCVRDIDNDPINK